MKRMVFLMHFRYKVRLVVFAQTYAKLFFIMVCCLLSQTSCNRQEDTFFEALIKGDLYTIKEIIERDKSYLEKPQEKAAMMTPLAVAVGNGNINIVKYLLEAGAEVNAKQLAANGSSTLNMAAYYGSPEILEVLLNYDAEVDIRDNFANTPLMSAVSGYRSWFLALQRDVDYARVVELLIQHGASINVINSDGQTALHRAVDSGFLKGANILLVNGADPNVVDAFGDTPYVYAMRNSSGLESEDLEAMLSLLKKFGAIASDRI